jgi:hypothetical protein
VGFSAPLQPSVARFIAPIRRPDHGSGPSTSAILDRMHPTRPGASNAGRCRSSGLGARPSGEERGPCPPLGRTSASSDSGDASPVFPGRIRDDRHGERLGMELRVLGSQEERRRRQSGLGARGPSGRAYPRGRDRSRNLRNPGRPRPGAARMTSTGASPNGNRPLGAKVATLAPHAGPLTRLAAWVVDVGVPRLVPDRVSARLRRRLRRVDDRLERAARRVTSHSGRRGR